MLREQPTNIIYIYIERETECGQGRERKMEVNRVRSKGRGGIYSTSLEGPEEVVESLTLTTICFS